MTLDEAFSDLKAKVAANTSAEQSARTLLSGISQQLRDLSASKPSFTADDLMAVAKQIDANNTDLASAVTDNTQAPTPPGPAATGTDTPPEPTPAAAAPVETVPAPVEAAPTSEPAASDPAPEQAPAPAPDPAPADTTTTSAPDTAPAA